MMQLFGNAEGERVLGLEELARMIEGVITDSFGRGYWIKAEMARLNLYPESGHCYPDLVEKSGKAIKAQMRGTIWAGNYQRIARQFLEVTREPLRDGLQILFFATVKFHPQYGLSLQITDIDPTYTLGQMARERMETIRKLREEGLFDKNRSLAFPVLPKRIAVISVQTSKGYSDFMNILENQASEFHFDVALFPALLQGDKAVESILGQLRTIRKARGHFDVAAIIRGGGGDVGLSCYDDYRLAREVATFPIPVLTGIGHSTNETVVEMVAARNKITPTDVAYSLVEQFRELSGRLEEITDFLREFSSVFFNDQRLLLKELAGQLLEGTQHQIVSRHLHMDTMLRTIVSQGRMKLIMEQQRLRLGESRITLLDPKNTLKRGYSITWFNGKPLRDASEVSAGDIITTELYQGKTSSTVNSKEK